MAGVTDTAFRQLCKLHGADVIYTEFASGDALVYENKKTRAMLAYTAGEQPVICQIFGHKPEVFFKAVKILEEMGFAGVDINFGCPAYKVVKSGGGVKLMRNLNLCRELVQAACEATSLPVSLKLRASIRRETNTNDKVENGTDEVDGSECNLDTVTALNLVAKIKDLPVAAIMLHARSYEQPFDGDLQLDIFQEVRRLWSSGILLFNGGIYTPAKAKEVLETTSADGLGIARGAWGKPWLFNQIKQLLATGTYDTLTWEQTKKIMLQHAELALAHKSDYGLIELRKHLSWYTKGRPNASDLRAKLVRVSSLDELTTILTNI